MDEQNLSKFTHLASIQQTFPNDDLNLFDTRQTATTAAANNSRQGSVSVTSPVTSTSKRLVNLLTPTNLKHSFKRHSESNNKLITTPIIASSLKV
jgi:hypothetical protein